MDGDRNRFVDMVLRNEVNREILRRAPALGVPDWWLTAGAVFQTVWNVLDGRAADAGITDYDVFYFDDSDLSWEAEDAVVQRANVPRLAPREVYEQKTTRWIREWPHLVIEPWPGDTPA